MLVPVSGAVHENVSCDLAVCVRVGVFGAPAITTGVAVTVSDGWFVVVALAALIAVTRTAYDVPLARPPSVNDVAVEPVSVDVSAPPVGR